MSGEPLHDPFGRSRLPPEHKRDPERERETRVRMLDEVRGALIAGHMPSREAAHYVGFSMLDWFESGGSLEHRLKVVKPKSHLTVSRIWASLKGKDVAHLDEDAPAEKRDYQSSHQTDLAMHLMNFVARPNRETVEAVVSALEAQPNQQSTPEQVREMLTSLIPATRAAADSGGRA